MSLTLSVSELYNNCVSLPASDEVIFALQLYIQKQSDLALTSIYLTIYFTVMCSSSCHDSFFFFKENLKSV